jgi:L-aspartate oxidase
MQGGSSGAGRSPLEEGTRSLSGTNGHARRFDAGALDALDVVRVRTLVIGSGVAGLRAGIEASAFGEVLVLGKSPQESTSTFRAQGGIAVAVDADDSPQRHLADTIAAGAGLCDEPVVRTMVEEGLSRVAELIDWGMRLDRTADGSLALGLEAAHSFARVVHSDGDATGRELVRCLVERASRCERLTCAEGWYAIDLVVEPGEKGDRVVGVMAMHQEHGARVFLARATILATGGAGNVYRDSSNPGASTGDGIAMAYRAGASVCDMAFVQFHPTALHVDGVERLLITEAVRGEGAYLLDAAGERFMLDEHPMGELAPRDVVSRAIAARIERDGVPYVHLDIRHVEGLDARFPGMSALLARVGLDPARDLIPVAPVAHFTIGGVRADASGRTDLPGLYAAGEVASTGFHGANRLASNSVLEGLVMGAAAVRAAESDGLDEPSNHGFSIRTHGTSSPCTDDVNQNIAALRSLMWSNVGIVRSGEGLREAARTIKAQRSRHHEGNVPPVQSPSGWKLRNMLLVADLITRSALWREESRGGHWRSDAPEPSEAFACHDVWVEGCDDEPERVPVARPVSAVAQREA